MFSTDSLEYRERTIQNTRDQLKKAMLIFVKKLCNNLVDLKILFRVIKVLMNNHFKKLEKLEGESSLQ